MSVELNKKLFEAAIEEKVDYKKIASLLIQGADPLGCFDEKYDDRVLDEIILDSVDKIMFDNVNIKHQIVDIVEFFIAKGFNPSKIEKGTGDSSSVMWDLSFITSESAIQILKLFIDNGLKVDALEDFIDHFFIDSEMVDGWIITDNDFENDTVYKESLFYGLRMVMLSASYPHILENSEYLRSCIDLDNTNKNNKYDLTKFRNYNNYDYELDLSTCDYLPYGLRNATVRIREKNKNNIIWVLHI